MNRYQKIDNPPSSVPPPPPSNNMNDSMRIHGSATASYAKSSQNGARPHDNKPSIHAIYSSNDSGFEPAGCPEIDYSEDSDDDDSRLPKKIPIRLVSSLNCLCCLFGFRSFSFIARFSLFRLLV